MVTIFMMMVLMMVMMMVVMMVMILMIRVGPGCPAVLRGELRGRASHGGRVLLPAEAAPVSRGLQQVAEVVHAPLQRSVDRGHGAHAAELQLHAGLRAAVGQRVELEPVPVAPGVEQVLVPGVPDHGVPQLPQAPVLLLLVALHPGVLVP